MDVRLVQIDAFFLITVGKVVGVTRILDGRLPVDVLSHAKGSPFAITVLLRDSRRRYGVAITVVEIDGRVCIMP